MQKHIQRLKAHRNVLYGVVIVLIILQIISFVTISSQISMIDAQQGVIKEDVDKYVLDLREEVDASKQESQFGIIELRKEINRQIETQQVDFEEQIDLLKTTTQQDFSGVIEQATKAVVSIVTDRSLGSGFVVAKNGYIVTNYHVIQGSGFVEVSTFDGGAYASQVIGIDPISDLALLKIERDLPILKLANSNNIQIGEKVIAIGNPLGLSFTVTEGIVSATQRSGPSGINAYIQTDVTLNPGNSGGPLINKEGEAIGINNFKIGGAESLGFALESNYIKQRLNLIAGQFLGQPIIA